MLALLARIGAPEDVILDTQGNLATTYEELGRSEEALRMKRDVYSGYVRLRGEENRDTCQVAENYALALIHLKRFEEAKSLLRKTIPVVRRVLGDNDGLTLRVRGVYAQALYFDAEATLDDLREAVTTLGEIERPARRVLGSTHPATMYIEDNLQHARAALLARLHPEPCNCAGMRNVVIIEVRGNARRRGLCNTTFVPP